MPLKRIVLIIMCSVLAVMVIMMGIVIGKVSPLFGMLFGPDLPTPTTPPTTQTDPSTEPTTTVDPTTESTVPPTTETTVPPTTETTHQHDFSKVKEEKKSTCSAAGYTIYECACGETKLETLEPLRHSFGAGELIKPDCTQGGYTLRKCSMCGFEDKQDEQPPLGHSYQVMGTVPVTCEADGYVEYQCERCKDIKHENVIKATGHTWVAGTVHAPTCDAEGYTEYACSNTGCGQTKEDDKLPALGHTFSAWAIETEPSPSVPGTEKRVCSVCNTEETRERELVILETNGFLTALDGEGQRIIVKIGAKDSTGTEIIVYTYEITDYSGLIEPVKASFAYDSEAGLVITLKSTATPFVMAPGNGSLILDKNGKPTATKPEPVPPVTDPAEGTTDPSAPVTDPTQGTTTPSIPVTDPTDPSVPVTDPTQGSTAPSGQPT